MDKEKPTSHICFAESGKDALSYLELLLKSPEAKKENFNPLLLSIGGNLDSEQKKEHQISLLLNKISICEETIFYSIADNDKAGDKYDLSFLAATNNALLNDEKIKITHKKHFSECEINNFNKEQIEKLKDFVMEQNSLIKPDITDNNNFGKFFILKEDYQKNSCTLHIPNDNSIYDYNSKFIEHANKNWLPNKFKKHKPVMKELNGDLDWNAYLMYKKEPKYFLERQQKHLKYKIKKA